MREEFNINNVGKRMREQIQTSREPSNEKRSCEERMQKTQSTVVTILHETCLPTLLCSRTWLAELPNNSQCYKHANVLTHKTYLLLIM